MYGIKRQFGLFLWHFLPKYDKTAGLVSLLLLMIGILPDIIWVYYSEDHKSESWDQLAYTNPAGTSHHRFVKLPISVFCQCCWPVTFPGVYVLLAFVCVFSPPCYSVNSYMRCPRCSCHFAALHSDSFSMR